jgi:hypothetical protein
MIDLRKSSENFGAEIMDDWNSVEKLLKERLPQKFDCMKCI